jgi:hypothetical protein
LPKTYLGDGVYVSHGAYNGEIVLTTENGISATNTIVLEPEVLAALILWLKANGSHSKENK